MRPVVLSIAGSDSSAGAGIQADLKSIEASGGYAATVITAVSAQNTRGVRRVDPLPVDAVAEQLAAVFDDLDVVAVKSGMLVSSGIIRAVSRVLSERRPRYYVCDPVLRSTSGFPLLDAGGVETLVREVLPLATLVTPNVHEAEVLSGVEIRDLQQAALAATRIRDRGARAVLVTGGHLRDAPATDVLVDAGGTVEFAARSVEARNTHGGGCAFASAVATALARGADLATAIRRGKRFVAEAMRHGLAIGEGPGPIDPCAAGRSSDES